MAFVVRSVSRHAKLRGGLLMNPKTVKKALKDAIQAMTDYKWLFSARSGKDNTRNRKFPFQKVIPFILAFRGGTLNHEIMDFFGLDPSTGTSSALGMIFWILPVVSLFTNGIMYRTAFGKEFDLAVFVPALLGVMFIFIGNYLPKVKQNRTLGIKISWTLNNEENWNKTHRFGGKVWVVGGLIMLFSVFLPLTAMVWIMVCVIAVMVIVPIVYSYYIYKQHQKEGIVYTTPPRSKAEKIAVKISAIIVPIILIGVAVLMFTGNIEVHCEDTSFTINATYWSDLEIDYSEVDTIEYRKDLDVGVRTNGFGSARLLMGIFQNDEFGSYTLYAYTGAKEFTLRI